MKHAALAVDDTALPADRNFETMATAMGRPAPSTGYASLLPVDPAHYAAERDLARGGMGRIRIARDRRLDRNVAIKELLVDAGDLAIRFEREARVTARLQHPSIVGVYEAGTWPSGEPFFAMKLVAGRSLDEVVADATTLHERLALLPNVLAIADAIAYAHNERIIHRDLKPRNVLVGTFGETVVVDWGLAKDLADAREDEAAAGPYRRNAAGLETEVGEVMGTPAYMPPEQARGERVDERADVYALGAILFHVLAGRPPITGKTTAEVFAKLLDEPTPSLADAQPAVPRDLLTIVAKAMAPSASDRYPSARELAEDLRRFQTGQLVGAHPYSLRELLRRWVRRHRTAITVAVAALAVLVVGGAFAIHRIVSAQQTADEQRVLAERESAEAKASRGQLEDMVDYMLVDMRDKLQPLGRVDLLADVAKKAAGYFESRSSETSSELGKRALAYHNLGAVGFDQGDVMGAHAMYRRERGVALQLVVQDPSEANHRVLARAHSDLASVLQSQGATDSAITSTRTALAIYEMLSARSPADPLRLRAVAAQETALADLLRATRRSDEAREHAERARSLLLPIASGDPTIHDELARAESAVAAIRYLQGKFDVALTHYRAAADGYEKAASVRPSAELQVRLAETKAAIGDTLLSSERTATNALAMYREAARVVEEVSERDPANIMLRRSVSFTQSKVCAALYEMDDVRGALDACKSAVSAIESVAAVAKTDVATLDMLVMAHEMLADVLDAMKDSTAAIASLRAAVAVSESLVRQDPTNRRLQRRLSAVQQSLGEILTFAKKPDEAMPLLRSALEIAQALAKTDPSSLNAKIDVAVTHLALGDAYVFQKNAGAAAVEYGASLALREEIAAADPATVRFTRAVMVTLAHIGDGLADAHDLAGARAAYERQLDVIDALLAKATTDDDRAELRGRAATAKAALAKCCTKKKPARKKKR